MYKVVSKTLTRQAVKIVPACLPYCTIIPLFLILRNTKFQLTSIRAGPYSVTAATSAAFANGPGLLVTKACVRPFLKQEVKGLAHFSNRRHVVSQIDGTYLQIGVTYKRFSVYGKSASKVTTSPATWTFWGSSTMGRFC